MSEPQTWSAPCASGAVRGTVTVPGSKSLTNRLLLLSALADGPAHIRAPLRSRDTLLMAQALRTLGTQVTGEQDWLVTPGPWHQATIDVGNAGTATRFLTAAAGLATGTVRIDGDPRMRERPMAALVAAIRELGVELDDTDGCLPLTVHGTGRVAGGQVTVDASASSQLVSGLLLAAASYDQGLTLRHNGPPVPSAPHIRMTVACLREAGAVVDDSVSDCWRVEPGSLTARDVTIEPDLSSASAFLCAAAVTAGEVTVTGWPKTSTQPGMLMPAILEAFGCSCHVDDGGLTVQGPARLHGADLDLRDHPEAVTTIAVVAALADSPSRIRGVAHLRTQETDRLAALVEELGLAGARISETADGLSISPARLHTPPRPLDPRADHRMAMAYAVLGLVVPGVTVSDMATVGKTFPDFPQRWAGLVA